MLSDYESDAINRRLSVLRQAQYAQSAGSVLIESEFFGLLTRAEPDAILRVARNRQLQEDQICSVLLFLAYIWTGETRG